MTAARELLGRIGDYTDRLRAVRTGLASARITVDDEDHPITAETDGWGLPVRIQVGPDALRLSPEDLGAAVTAALGQAAEQADRHRAATLAAVLGGD